MLLETAYQPWRKARSTNQTSTSFVAKLASLTTPAGDANTAIGQSILEMGAPAALTQNGLMLHPYGTASDGNTFSLRVLGWGPSVTPNSVGIFTWFPTLLCELLCTVSSTNVGIASGFVVATELFAKTIAVTYGNANVSVEAVSPATAGLNASALVDIKGFQKIEVTFSTGSSATDCNSLCRFL